MTRKLLPSFMALLALAALASYFPPGKFTWHRFLQDSMPLSGKVVYLLKVYALPALLSFTAVVLFQLQVRGSMVGAPAYAVFPLSVIGATAMLAAFRTMTMGMGGIPGYVVGLAGAYTMMSRFAGFQPSGRYRFGVQTLRIVWRGNPSLAQRPASRPALERRAG